MLSDSRLTQLQSHHHCRAERANGSAAEHRIPGRLTRHDITRSSCLISCLISCLGYTIPRDSIPWISLKVRSPRTAHKHQPFSFSKPQQPVASIFLTAVCRCSNPCKAPLPTSFSQHTPVQYLCSYLCFFSRACCRPDLAWFCFAAPQWLSLGKYSCDPVLHTEFSSLADPSSHFSAHQLRCCPSNASCPADLFFAISAPCPAASFDTSNAYCIITAPAARSSRIPAPTATGYRNRRVSLVSLCLSVSLSAAGDSFVQSPQESAHAPLFAETPIKAIKRSSSDHKPPPLPPPLPPAVGHEPQKTPNPRPAACLLTQSQLRRFAALGIASCRAPN